MDVGRAHVVSSYRDVTLSPREGRDRRQDHAERGPRLPPFGLVHRSHAGVSPPGPRHTSDDSRGQGASLALPGGIGRDSHHPLKGHRKYIYHHHRDIQDARRHRFHHTLVRFLLVLPLSPVLILVDLESSEPLLRLPAALVVDAGPCTIPSASCCTYIILYPYIFYVRTYPELVPRTSSSSHFDNDKRLRVGTTRP